jgi:hypothetical protein
MRLWSLHPKYLDARGLVALWREALLAQAVLRGRANGYLHHPQLHRFRDSSFPVRAIAQYLRVIHGEAVNRGYSFAAGKIGRARPGGRLNVTKVSYSRTKILNGYVSEDGTIFAGQVDPRWVVV